MRKPTIALEKLPVDEHVLNVPDTRVKHHRRYRVRPAQESRAPPVKDYEVRFRTYGDRAKVRTPQGEGALAGCKQEGLVYRHCGLVLIYKDEKTRDGGGT